MDRAQIFIYSNLLLHVTSTDMGKKKNVSMTHEEIWDDSALMQSWDDAVEEYQVSSVLSHVITI